MFEPSSEFMIENKLLSSTQLGFRPNDYCVNQLFSVTLSIFSAFDENSSLKVGDASSEVSKAFDRVWHKLKNSGMNGNNLDLLE